jgi:antitoxin MazE3
MSKQIAVRLPDDIVEFVDDLVADGHATSRASVVSHALDRERRRRLAAKDAAILAGAEQDRELDDLARYAAGVELDDLA